MLNAFLGIFQSLGVGLVGVVIGEFGGTDD
jgi:hypothetical protein